ncbi:MAG: NnrU family protein [Hyphomonadaceae bacterium]
MSGSVFFYGGLVVFFATHLFSAFRSRGENDIKRKLGAGPYMGLYSLISLAGLVAFIYGFGMVRDTVLIWEPPVWTKHLALALMLPALIFLVAAYAPRGYIKAALKHPMLVAVKVWAVAHLAANGELHAMILFGSFLAFAVVDRIAVKNRPVGTLAKPSLLGDAISVLVGGGVYVGVLFWFHPEVIGKPILP